MKTSHTPRMILTKLTDARNDMKQGFIAYFATEKTISSNELSAMKHFLTAKIILIRLD